MKKEDSKAKVYGQNKKIWYLCIPYYFLRNPTMSLLETKMGDKGLLIYMRLLFLATESQGILRLDNTEEETFFGKYLDNDDAPSSPISSIVSALGNRYTEQEIYKTLKLLEQVGAIKVLAEEQVRFRDVYEMGIEKQLRAAEKRAQKGRKMFDGDGDGLEESEEPEEAPAQIEEQQEETEAKPEKKRKKKPAPVRHRYGEYNNVLLSDEDMEKLKAEFPNDYQKRIEDLSGYMESNGKDYKNHLATIRNWAKRNGDTPQKGQQTTQKTQAPTRESVKKRLEKAGVISYAGVDHASWNKVQDKYTDEEKVWAVTIMAENEI